MGRKYNCNYDYFKEIDTEDKSYWLGFLYADGSIHKTKHTMDLVLSINDKEHLYKVNNYLESTYPIKIERNKYVKLTIHNKYFGELLIDKGCIPTKSLKLNFPTNKQVPSHLIRHFIRGYFDGDGCICNRIVNEYMKSCINILGTYDFLTGVATSLPNDEVSVKQRHGYKIHNITIYNKLEIIKIFHYFYDDSTVYLERKYNKFLEMIEYVNKDFS